MRKLSLMAAALLAMAVPGTALAQHHGDRGSSYRGHDAPRNHDRDYRSNRHGSTYYDFNRGYRSHDGGYYRGNDYRYDRRDRYDRYDRHERRNYKRKQHHRLRH